MKKFFSLLLAFIMLTASAAAYEDIMPLGDDLVIIPISVRPPLVLPLGGSPSGIAVAEDGTLWITDVWQRAVWTWDGEELTKAAGYSEDTDLLGMAIGGNTDGPFEKASFQTPYAIVQYGGGFAVSDTDNDSVRLLKDGMVTTIAKADSPTGLACDDAGNLYIASSGSDTIFIMDKDGNLEPFLDEGLSEPAGLCWYGGILFVADSANHRILTAQNGVVSVLAGGADDSEDALYGGTYRNGIAERAGFSYPQGVLACEEGVFVADSGNGVLRLIKDGFVSTVWGGSVQELYPASPRGMVLLGDSLLVCDIYAQVVFETPAGLPQSFFTDVSGGDAILTEALYQARIFNGFPDKGFHPDQIINRADFLTALSRLNTFMYPYEIITGYGGFDDVPKDAYYAEAISWAADNEIVHGTGYGKFSPDLDVTRESAAVMMYNYIHFCGYDADPTASGITCENASVWARDAVIWAVSSGIIDQSADPQGALTRLEAAKILYAFMQWM